MRELKFRAWDKLEEVMGEAEVINLGKGGFQL